VRDRGRFNRFTLSMPALLSAPDRGRDAHC
jgi:hypothetical protein